MLERRAINASLTVTFGLAALMLLLGLASPWSQTALEFNRELIAEGQWWRLLTSHWVHYGWYHLAMNACAFLLCGYILLADLTLRRYVLLLCTCLLGVGFALYWLDPQLHRYTGLSGVLHGLVAAGLILSHQRAPWVSSAALILLAGKLVHEQSVYFDPNHPLLLAPVAVNAHYFGAAAGVGFALTDLAQRRLLHRPRII